MKDYTSEINILRKCYNILQKQLEIQFLKDLKHYTKNQKIILNKINLICEKIIYLQWNLYN